MDNLRAFTPGGKININGVATVATDGSLAVKSLLLPPSNALLNYYDTGTFNFHSSTGVSGTITMPTIYQIAGSIVHLWLASGYAAFCNRTQTTFTGLPSSLQPQDTIVGYFPLNYYNTTSSSYLQGTGQKTLTSSSLNLNLLNARLVVSIPFGHCIWNIGMMYTIGATSLLTSLRVVLTVSELNQMPYIPVLDTCTPSNITYLVLVVTIAALLAPNRAL